MGVIVDPLREASRKKRLAQGRSPEHGHHKTGKKTNPAVKKSRDRPL